MKVHQAGAACALTGILFALSGAGGCGTADETRDEGENAEAAGEGAFPLSRSEVEPNDSPDGPNVLRMGMRDDNHGSFPGGDTVDYWTFSLPVRTYVNVFLGDIPDGSDYDVDVFRRPDLNNPVWRGTNGGDTDELTVRRDMAAGDYVVRVYAVSGPGGGAPYRLRYAITSISRAWQWVDARMPYCGAINGAKDPLCDGRRCVRTGDAAHAEWDPYRSDCSGLVSWAWGLPPPGRTTWQLPDVSIKIPAQSLFSGDILLTHGHVVLFDSWVDEGAGGARILQESECGGVASAEQVTLTLSPGSSDVGLWGETYTAYRYVMP